MKKIFGISLILCLVAVSLSGCKPDTQPLNPTDTLDQTIDNPVVTAPEATLPAEL